mmetsp:Transcript_49504/g.159075  ORF Transcript_49504/g.159075 Transcript_49504/m.159075 type:complete len:214 (-) Transcript_49504:159-800(-)
MTRYACDCGAPSSSVPSLPSRLALLAESRSTRSSRSVSAFLARERSSSAALSCARSTSVCTLISSCRSAIESCSWLLRFSSPKTPSVRPCSASRSFLTSSRSRSAATVASCRCCASFLICFCASVLSTSTASIAARSRASSVVTSSSRLRARFSSLDSRFSCSLSMRAVAPCCSSCLCSVAIWDLSSVCSSAERTPVARATFRCMSCSWKSAV